MEKQIQQLVEMGATPAQARAALRESKDVMDAAEKFFEGKYAHIGEDDEMEVADSTANRSRPVRMVTPDDEDEEEDGINSDGDDGDDDGDDYVDYDSDYDQKAEQSRTAIPEVDPYAGIFFSKDRREEVIEVEEEPESAYIPEVKETVKLMSQGEWMKGCPEGGEQGFLFSLYNQLTVGVCPCPNQCGQVIHRKKADFFAIYSEFSTYTDILRKNVRRICDTCNREFCLACGEAVTEAPGPGRVARHSNSSGGDPLFHCANIQGVILGVGLSMLQTLHAEQAETVATAGSIKDKGVTKKRKAEEATPKAETPGSLASDADEEEDYYGGGPRGGKKAKGGTGYAGNVKEDTTGQAEALAVQRLKDEKMGKLLTDVRNFLPSVQRPGGGQMSDYLPHPTALAHLRRRFNLVGSSLLRNDSLTDMSDRSVLYFELFEWLETISNHEALASMMAMPIMVVASVKTISSKKSTSSRASTRERTIVYEGSSGPRELLEAIVIQAQAAMKGLEGMLKLQKEKEDPEQMTEEQKRMTNEEKGKGKAKDSQQSDENARLLQFCQRILATAKAIDRSLCETKGEAFVKRLHASLPKIPNSGTDGSAPEVARVSNGSSDEEVTRTYIDWATRVRFEYCDLSIPSLNGSDETPNYKFYYNNEARMLANSDIPKRSLAIAKELAVLTTNLPVAWDSSVFLRVDETRVDIIKALITGPEGTPYHNGCYLFDIFLGPSYNQAPPSVKYMTTNGGKFRFNPNLYADGKVCLSLLGTWSGPGWVSGKSTLLQVLISIQSMILCEEPYLNEPGWATQGGTPQSAAYSANVRRMVVNTAMLGNLKSPPEPFGDIIRTHFRLKARSITEQLDKWLAMDDGKATNGQGAEYQPSLKFPTIPFGSGEGSMSPFQKDVAELKALLRDLQNDDKDTISVD